MPKNKSPYYIIETFHVGSTKYERGKVHHFDPITARALKQRGVIPDEPVDDGPEEPPEDSGIGPSNTPGDDGPTETPEDEQGPSEDKSEGLTQEWLKKARAALESDNGNDIRSALAAVRDSTSKWKEENERRLRNLVEVAESNLGDDG